MQIKKENILIVLSFATLYIVWGSTYLAVKTALYFLPPWLLAGTRFTVAGSIMLIAMRLVGWQRASLKQWAHAAFLGLCIMTIGMGFTAWAQQYLDTGIAALLVGTNPLMTVILAWLVLGRRPSWMGILGVVMGLVGMYMLVNQTSVLSFDGAFAGVLMTLFAVFTWSFATIILPKLDIPESKVQLAGMELITAGVTLLVISFFVGEFEEFVVAEVSNLAWASWAYLVVFGSILVFSAFNYLLVKVTPEKVSTAAYVNPIIAVSLGWWVRSEVITEQTVLAMGLMLLGVYFINKE